MIEYRKTNEICRNGQIFTPQVIAEFMVKLYLDGNPKKILEPSCGTGIFIRELLRIFKDKKGHSIVTVEKDPNLFKKFLQNFRNEKDNVKLFNGDFLELYRNLSKFDLIIGNRLHFEDRQEYKDSF